MVQPQGYVNKGHESKVCKLNKEIYGLKQKDRKWYKRQDRSMIRMGFAKSSFNSSLYYMRKGRKFLYLLVYVDNILLASNPLELINIIIELLSAEFEMTELGELTYLLGVQIYRFAVVIERTQICGQCT